MMKTFKKIGGIRYGFFNASWPLSFMIATKEELKIRTLLFFPVAISKESIVKLTVIEKSWFRQGIGIEHCDETLPRELIFWTFQPNWVGIELNLLGYPVE